MSIDGNKSVQHSEREILRVIKFLKQKNQGENNEQL